MSLDTSLYYLVDSSEKPALFTFKPGPGDEPRIPEYRRFPVVIRDTRE